MMVFLDEKIAKTTTLDCGATWIEKMVPTSLLGCSATWMEKKKYIRSGWWSWNTWVKVKVETMALMVYEIFLGG